MSGWRPPHNLEAGAVVGDRFTVERLAGRGGMSDVYRAVDQRTNEIVALKVLNDIDQTDRFLREAQVLSSLRHSAIVRYIAHAVAPTPFIVMQWLEGEDLGRRLRRHELTVQESVVIVHRVAEALVAAHRAGVIHRDIKPSNIFLEHGAAENAILLDFGIAHVVDPVRALTRTGLMIGTVGFLAPEQAKGESKLDGRVDIFALGCVFYRCLTGEPPFSGDHPAVLLAKLLFSEPARLSERRSDMPATLDSLVHRMLAKSADDRPATAEQVVIALGSLAGVTGDRPIAARSDSGAEVRSSSVSRHELRLTCLILANHCNATEAGGDDSIVFADGPTRSEPQTLSSLVASFGGTMQILADQSVMVVLPSALAATDLAIQGVRCALAMKELLPTSMVVVSLGHSDSMTGLPTQPSIEQIDVLLTEEPSDDPGAVVADDATAHLLDTRFEVRKLARGSLVRIADRAADPSRYLLGKPTPCVGREQELALLTAMLNQAVHEDLATAVLITAGPGMGKSRLCHEFLRRVRTESTDVDVWHAHADPLSSGSAFSLLGSLVRVAASILGGEPEEVCHGKLRERVAAVLPEPDVPRVTEFLAEIAGVRVKEPSPQLRSARQDPTLMNDQLTRAWKEFVTGVCELKPLLVIAEDLHWGDHPSVRLIDASLRTTDHPLMILALARPEVHQVFPRLWADRRFQELRLPELSRKARTKLITHVLGADLSEAMVAHLSQLCEGNAFYLEELIRSVAEGKTDGLPMTVLAMAEARLQRLDPAARHVLRAGSIFGERFWRGAIGALLRHQPAATIDAMIEELIEGEVIAPSETSRFANEQQLSFRHDLLRNAAYATIAVRDRASDHKLAGEWLEARGERDAVILGQHFEHGGDPERARAYYKRAAEQAFDGNDLESALKRAELAVRCGATGTMLGELRLLQAEVKGWHGKVAEQLPLAREAFANLPPGAPHAFRAAEQIAVASCRTGNKELLREAGDSMATLEPAQAITCGYMWPLARAVNQLLLMGETAHAQRLVGRMEDLRDRVSSDDPAAAICITFASALAALFDLEPVPYVRDIDHIVEVFEQCGFQRYAALQSFHVAFACAALGADDEGLRRSRRSLETAQRLDLAIYASGSKAILGWFLARAGQFDEGLRLANEGLAFSIAVGQKLMEGNVRCNLAAIYELAGDLDAAVQEASIASTLSGLAPTFRGVACGRLARLHLAKHRPAEALAASTEAMRLLFPAGNLFGSHIMMWLAHIDALDATGQHDEAERSRREARTWLQQRVDRIEPAHWRKMFVAIPEHRRLLSAG